MRLIVVDPRHVGLANKADLWLRVRPGTDGALALGLANVMIERGWYDRDFIRTWSNGPLLVRADTGRLLTEPTSADGDARAAAGTRGGRSVRPASAAMTATARASRWRANTASPRRRRRGLPSGLRALRPALPAISAGAGRGDLLDPARPGRGGRPADLARPAGLLLRLERPRAARQRHPDGARHVAALRADRLLRRARRQRAVPGAAVGVDHRRGAAGGKAHGADAGPCRTPARAGALRQRHHPRSLPRDPGGEALSGPRPDRLRRQHAAGASPMARTAARRWRRWSSTPTPICS